MADKIKVQMSNPHDGHAVGDKVDLDPVDARRYVRNGVAVYATVPEAKKAGADPDEAATKR